MLISFKEFRIAKETTGAKLLNKAHDAGYTNITKNDIENFLDEESFSYIMLDPWGKFPKFLWRESGWVNNGKLSLIEKDHWGKEEHKFTQSCVSVFPGYLRFEGASECMEIYLKKGCPISEDNLFYDLINVLKNLNFRNNLRCDCHNCDDCYSNLMPSDGINVCVERLESVLSNLKRFQK